MHRCINIVTLASKRMAAGVNEAGVLKLPMAEVQSVLSTVKSGVSSPNCLLYINICKLRLMHHCDLARCAFFLLRRLRMTHPATGQKANLVKVLALQGWTVRQLGSH